MPLFRIRWGCSSWGAQRSGARTRGRAEGTPLHRRQLAATRSAGGPQPRVSVNPLRCGWGGKLSRCGLRGEETRQKRQEGRQTFFRPRVLRVARRGRLLSKAWRLIVHILQQLSLAILAQAILARAHATEYRFSGPCRVALSSAGVLMSRPPPRFSRKSSSCPSGRLSLHRFASFSFSGVVCHHRAQNRKTPNRVVALGPGWVGLRCNTNILQELCQRHACKLTDWKHASGRRTLPALGWLSTQRCNVECLSMGC